MSKKRRTAEAEGARSSKKASSGATDSRSSAGASGSDARPEASAGPRSRATKQKGAAKETARDGSAAGGFDVATADVVEAYSEVATAISEATSLQEAVARVVDHLCRLVPWAAGYGVVNPLADERSEAWHSVDQSRLGDLREALGQPTRSDPAAELAAGDPPPSDGPRVGLVDRALRSGLPVVVDTLDAGDEIAEAEVASAAGLRSCYAFPVFAANDVVAVLAFFANEEGPLPETLGRALEFSVRQLEVAAEAENAQRAVTMAAQHARAQAAELNEMALRLRTSGDPSGGGMYDALTGFPRRRLLLDRLQQALRRRRRNPELQFALAYLGLEGLREVREELGLRASEEFLLALCRRIEGEIRPADTIGRPDEHEFVIILEDTEGPEDARAAAERIQASIGRPYRLDGEEVRASASIGLAMSNTRYEHAEAILRDAAAALRASRAYGDETPRVFDLAEQPRFQNAPPNEEELLRAVHEGEMQLEYHPVVSLETGRVDGFEAHVRWRHPERGSLSPQQFLAESGAGPASSALLAWSLKEACQQAVEWVRRGPEPPFVAIVLTSEQFYSPGLVTEAWDVLTSTDLEGSNLRFVVGESVLTTSPGPAKQVVAGLGALEVGVVIDGFGTGYSSLPHLHELRPRALKIERAFLTGSSDRPSQWLVARTIVELARIVEADAIANGIETREQLARLLHLGCQFAQGPYFGGGVAADKTVGLVRGGLGSNVRELRSPGEGEARAESPFSRFLARDK